VAKASRLDALQPDDLSSGDDQSLNAPLYWRLVKFGFRLLYNRWHSTYDAVSWMPAWVSGENGSGRVKHLNVQPDAHVLELAHGTGNLQLDLRAAD